jgi:hypothetical protein
VQYERCDFTVDIYEVIYCESHVIEGKYMIDWGRDYSVVRVTGLVELPVDGLHISILNYYYALNMITDKVFFQIRDQIFAILLNI